MSEQIGNYHLFPPRDDCNESTTGWQVFTDDDGAPEMLLAEFVNESDARLFCDDRAIDDILNTPDEAIMVEFPDAQAYADHWRALLAGWAIAPIALRALLLDLPKQMTVAEMRAALKTIADQDAPIVPREAAKHINAALTGVSIWPAAPPVGE